MLTMIYMEMFFVPPIHQLIVAPPAVRVDDTIVATRPRIAAGGAFLTAFGAISV